MALSRGTLILLGVVVFLGVALANVHAAPPEPQVPSSPPQTSLSPPAVSRIVNEPSSVESKLPPLKAVLLVGPIDGDDGSWTTREKQNMDLAADELAAKGVAVHKFYTPDNDWSQIKAAAEGAHFMFYRGHGVYWSSFPNPTVGGFYLKNKFVSSAEIRNDLHLAPNAIVMLYGCFTAGSSSIDGGPISSQEAQRRVAQYSDPFFETGAAGYYADWFGSAFQMYVRYLFQEMTLGEAYEAYFDFSAATVERYVHPNHPYAVMWLDKDDWGYTKYNNAFVGLADQTLVGLFATNAMKVSPAVITYQAETSFLEHPFLVQVEATGSDTFTWTASVSPSDASWLSVAPQSGSSGQTMTVVINPNGKALGTYQAQVHVVTDTPGITDAEQDILVTLHVVKQVRAIYLPVVNSRVP
jgi:hypothetical protein